MNIENEGFTERVVSEDHEVLEIFNEFFVNILPNLDIPAVAYFDENFFETDDSVTNAIHKFNNHPSILMIILDFLQSISVITSIISLSVPIFQIF